MNLNFSPRLELLCTIFGSGIGIWSNHVRLASFPQNPT